MPQPSRHIAYISPLPPPAGGIATWTKTIQNRGLGDNWRSSIVDTRLRGRSVADHRTSLLTESLRTARMVGGLLRTLLFHRPDLVHLNSSLSEKGVFRDALAVAMARLFRVPVVSSLHGNFLPGERTALSRWTKAAYQFILRHSARIVVLNSQSREGVCELGDFTSIISIMPNFVDLNLIPEKSESKNSRFCIAYIGTLIESKGLATIIESASRLPEIDFVLVGDAPETQESSHLLKRGVALPNIEITGSLTQSSAFDILAESDALIFPSHSEGFPFVVAEAMAVGLPVIASPVGAISEMIDQPAGGYLIPQDLISEYVEAIRTLDSDRQLALEMGALNRNKAQAQYSYEEVISRWRRIYESII